MTYLIVPLAALIPLILGFIWYHPKVFGKAWLRASGMIDEAKKGGMVKIFLFTYLFSLMLAVALMPIVIHQMHIFSLLAAGPEFKDTNSEHYIMFNKMMASFGNEYRTFKHGAFHGTIAGLFLALPILGINALFERKSFKYILIHAGYWALTMALMGGVLCAFVEM